MSDGGGRKRPRMGEVGMREFLFLKNKLREAHRFMEGMLVENQRLKEDNALLRRLLWKEMTEKKEKEEGEDVEMDEAMEDCLL